MTRIINNNLNDLFLFKNMQINIKQLEYKNKRLESDVKYYKTESEKMEYFISELKKDEIVCQRVKQIKKELSEKE
jgi:hypothetical protein